MKKIIFSLFFLLTTFYILHATPLAFAQTVPPTNTIQLPDTNPDVPKNVGTLTYSIISSFLSTINCGLSGIDISRADGKCLTTNPKTGTISYSDPQHSPGALGMLTNLISISYVYPAHTADYINYLAFNFHPLGGKAYADVGIGLSGLSPLLKIWVAFRNIAYLLMVLVFMLIGLAIMLRVKIDPRTVMTIQNRIPKIIVGLILITFSFAIAGLLIDAMYVVSYFVLNIAASAIGQKDLANLALTQQNVFSAANTFNGGSAGGFLGSAYWMGNVVKQVANNLIGQIPVLGGIVNLLSIVAGGWICYVPIIGGALSQTFCGDNIGLFGQGIIGPLAFLGFLLAIIFSLVRLWIALMKAYLTILFNVVLGPFIILFGLIPNAPGGFSTWFRTVAANLTIFPAVLVFLLLGHAFAKAFSGAAGAIPLFGAGPFNLYTDLTSGGTGNVGATGNVFVPPLIGNLGQGLSGIGAILNFITLMMVSKVPEEVTKMFKAQQELGNAVLQGAAPGFKAAFAPLKGGWKAATRAPDPYGMYAPGFLFRPFLNAYEKNPNAPGAVGGIGKFILRMQHIDPERYKKWQGGAPAAGAIAHRAPGQPGS